MERLPEPHSEEPEVRLLSRKEIEAIMRKARTEFNEHVRVRPVPRYTRDARVSTVFGPNSAQDSIIKRRK